MNGHGQSDGPVVPANPPNKASAAVVGEERGPAKGNTASATRPGRSAGSGASRALDRVRQVAVGDKEARFTALLHHVDVDRLRTAYWAIRPQAAPGEDGVTWVAYGQELEANLADLHRRVHSGGYRASPSRRVYIPKADGRLRPLGIASLEDKTGTVRPGASGSRRRSTSWASPTSVGSPRPDGSGSSASRSRNGCARSCGRSTTNSSCDRTRSAGSCRDAGTCSPGSTHTSTPSAKTLR